MSSPDPTDPRQAFFGKVGFDKALPGMSLVSASGNSAVVRLEVSEPVKNWVDTLHGGAIATLVDIAGTVAIVSADREQRAGVTTDLNVSYFSAAPLGTTVEVRATALKTGRSLAFVSVDVVDPNDNDRLLAQGRMTKFMPPRRAE